MRPKTAIRPDRRVSDMCSAKLNDGPLICDRRDDHDEHARGGHTFTASWLGDNHDKTEARDE